MRKSIAILIGILTSTYATAGLKVTAPSQACNLVSEVGLKTRGWKNHYDQEFGCSSPYKDIGSASPLPNNLAFYAEGNSSSVNLVKLVLNINAPSAASTANKELQKAVTVLIPKITGEKASPSLLKAISQGKSTSMKMGSSTVKVIRYNWPTGKGHEIKVIVN
jgi:hypothetical protein